MIVDGERHQQRPTIKVKYCSTAPRKILPLCELFSSVGRDGSLETRCSLTSQHQQVTIKQSELQIPNIVTWKNGVGIEIRIEASVCHGKLSRWTTKGTKNTRTQKAMSKSNDAGHFFQTSAALETTSRKEAKAKNKHGKPIQISSKVLAAHEDIFSNSTTPTVYVAEAAGEVKRVRLEVGESHFNGIIFVY